MKFVVDHRVDLKSTVLRLFALRLRLLEFFEPAKAEAFLLDAHPDLGQLAPCDLVATDEGLQRVLDVIERLRDGAHS